MLQPEYNLTITGTVRKNKKEIPREMKLPSDDPPSAKFFYTEDMTLVSYSPKKHKFVLLVSSYMSTSESTNGKPHTVLHYNVTKGGTDCFDQLCHAYTVTRRTLRWPMRFFFGILDQAAVNAWILFNCQNMKDGIKPDSAIECLESLYVHLVTPHLQDRYDNETMHKDILTGIASILGHDVNYENPQNRRLLTKKRCYVCSRKNDTKTREACYSCARPVCVHHRVHMCRDCVGRE